MATEAPAAVVLAEPAIEQLTLDEKAVQAPHDTPLAVSAAGSTTEWTSPAPEKVAEPATSSTNPPEFITATPGQTVQTPFTAPLPTSKPAPAADLTAEQQKKYDELLEIVLAWESVPVSSARDAATEPINDTERMWLTRECLLRYLRAT